MEAAGGSLADAAVAAHGAAAVAAEQSGVEEVIVSQCTVRWIGGMGLDDRLIDVVTWED